MTDKQEFESLVDTVKEALKQTADSKNAMRRIDIPEYGPLDSDVADMLRDPIKSINDAIKALSDARLDMVKMWLRTGASRTELSDISGIGKSTIRKINESVRLENE